MILTVDIGNSNIVLGVVEENEILFEARLRTDATKTSDEYCIDLKMIMEVNHVEVNAIEGSIVASVVPPVLNSIQTAIMKLTGKKLDGIFLPSFDTDEPIGMPFYDLATRAATRAVFGESM
jgi:type III pantothenate kinase